MIFALRDGQKWNGPGIAHLCWIPHWRLGGIPQGISKGNKHPSSHSRVPPQGLCAVAGRSSSKSWAQSETGCFIPQASFVFSLLNQKGLNSMFVINTKIFCSAWGKQTYLQGFYCYAELGLAKVTVLFFLPPSSCNFFKPHHFLSVWMKSVRSLLSATSCVFFPKLLFKLIKAVSDSVLHCLSSDGRPSRPRLNAGLWEVALLVVTKLILTQEWLGFLWCTLKCNLNWISWVCNA